MTPSLEGSPTKAKEAPSPHEVRLAPLDTNPVEFSSPLSFAMSFFIATTSNICSGVRGNKKLILGVRINVFTGRLGTKLTHVLFSAPLDGCSG